MRQTRQPFILCALAYLVTASATAQVSPPPATPVVLPGAVLAKPGLPVIPTSGEPQGQPQPPVATAKVGTLERIENLMREQAELDIKQRRTMSQIANGIPPMMPPQVVAPNGIPNGGGMVPPREPARPESELSDYRTVSIVTFDGRSSADISQGGYISTVRVGDKLKEWRVSNITMDGVLVEKTVTVHKGKAKEEKKIKYVLQAARDAKVEALTMPPGSPVGMPASLPAGGSQPGQLLPPPLAANIGAGQAAPLPEPPVMARPGDSSSIQQPFSPIGR